MEFQRLKLALVKETGLEKDALHIYVGLGVYLIALLFTRPIIKRHLTRQNIALVASTCIALLGEYLDLRVHPLPLTSTQIAASVHDVINTCFWVYVLYGVNRWTSLFCPDSDNDNDIGKWG